MSTPAVVFSLGFEYDWKIGGYDYLEYMSRPEAFKKEYHLVDEYKDFVDYMSNEEKSDGLFDNEKNFLTDADKEKYRAFETQSRDEGCPKYYGVVSFDNKFLEEYGIIDGNNLNTSRLKEYSRKAINELINKSDKLQNDNVYWNAAIHTNTDNIHIHYSLCEYHRLEERTIKYRDKDCIEIKALDALKSKMANAIVGPSFSKELTDLYRNTLLPNFKNHIANSCNDLIQLNQLLPKDSALQYGRKSMKSYRHLIDDCVDNIFSSSQELLNLHDQYFDKIDTLSDKAMKMFGTGKRMLWLKTKNKRIEDFRSRTGNAVLNELRRIRLSEEDEGFKKQNIRSTESSEFTGSFSKQNNNFGLPEPPEVAGYFPEQNNNFGLPEPPEDTVYFTEQNDNFETPDPHEDTVYFTEQNDDFGFPEPPEDTGYFTEQNDNFETPDPHEDTVYFTEQNDDFGFPDPPEETEYFPEQNDNHESQDEKKFFQEYEDRFEFPEPPEDVKFFEEQNDIEAFLNDNEQQQSDALSEKQPPVFRKKKKPIYVGDYCMDWSDTYKKATSIMYSKNHTEASLSKAEDLFIRETKKGNVLASCNLGKLYEILKEPEKAQATYKKAFDGFTTLLTSENKDFIKNNGEYIHYRIGKLYSMGKGTEQSHEEAYKHFCLAPNNHYANFSLGSLYKYGNGVEKDYEKAFKCYEFASQAKKGMPYADYCIANAYENGEGVNSDLDKAEIYYEKALQGFLNCEMDENIAYKIGMMYLKGQGTEIDLVKAEKHLLFAEEKENFKACSGLGQLYIQLEEYEKAEEHLLKAAEQNNQFAQYALGKFYLDEPHQDFIKAEQYLLKAAGQDNQQAQYALGKFYLDEPHQDLTKAEQFLLKAAEHDNQHAQYALGKFYLEEPHQDFTKAEQFLLKAADHDNQYAQYELGKFYLDEKHQDLDKAEQFLLNASEHDNQYAQYYLGKLYLSGPKQDISKAKRCFSLSADKENQNAQIQLGFMCLKSGDIGGAKVWFAKAASLGNIFAQQQLHKINNPEEQMSVINNNMVKAINSIKRLQNALDHHLRQLQSEFEYDFMLQLKREAYNNNTLTY